MYHLEIDCDSDDDVERPKQIRPMTDFEAKLEAWCEECDKIPSMYGDERGEVDMSKAASIEIDGPALKKICAAEYRTAVYFAYECRQKSHLKLFHHPGDPRMDGLSSCSGKRLNNEHRDLACRAIEQYQKVNQKVKLKLRHLMKLNGSGSGGVTYYITFSAEDELTGEIKTYQAALMEFLDGQIAENEVTGEIKTYQAALKEFLDGHLLGLFRNLVDDEILAILSIKGGEEDLEALRPSRDVSDELSDY